jgi:hypothetical protein
MVLYSVDRPPNTTFATSARALEGIIIPFPSYIEPMLEYEILDGNVAVASYFQRPLLFVPIMTIILKRTYTVN